LQNNLADGILQETLEFKVSWVSKSSSGSRSRNPMELDLAERFEARKSAQKGRF
jgi:hypothetical protein